MIRGGTSGPSSDPEIGGLTMIDTSMPLLIGLVPLLLLAIAVAVRPVPAAMRAVRAKPK